MPRITRFAALVATVLGAVQCYGQEVRNEDRLRSLPAPFQMAPLQSGNRQVIQASAQEPVEEAPTRLPSRSREKSLPLAPPSNQDGETRSARGTSSLWALFGSLALVSGLFCAVAWVLRRGMPKGLNLLPRGAVEVLGRTPIAARQQVYLVRCGGKMLLLSVTPAGIETLTEITNPVEVDRLAGICQQSHPHSSTKAFQHVFKQFDTEPAPAGFASDTSRSPIDFSQLGAGKSRGGVNG